eukprot:937110-Pyramimonas_sp.AAC.1
MPPKRKAHELPSACEELKALLGSEVAALGIAGVEHAVRKKAFSSLNSTLKNTHPDKYNQYQQLHTDEERRNWLAAFLIDPASGGSTATNTVSREVSRKEKTVGQWMTIDEYGGPKGINNMEHAKARCEAGEFTERPHESPILAAKDIKQYYVTIEQD